jgi:hypothetical protein
MKQHHMFVLIRPGAACLAGQQWPRLFRSVGRRLAVCVTLMQCLISVQAGDAFPAREPNTQPAQVLKTANIPHGRQMERYKAFARQAELPPMTVTNHTVLGVGGVMHMDTTRLAQLSTRERETLAGQFRVPVAVIDRFVQRLVISSPPAADRLAQEIRTVVIDYRFLQIEWERYHPSAQGQKTKAAALEALQAGDISKAWELYDGLRRPQAPAIAAPAPPANLRVVAQP